MCRERQREVLSIGAFNGRGGGAGSPVSGEWGGGEGSPETKKSLDGGRGGIFIARSAAGAHQVASVLPTMNTGRLYGGAIIAEYGENSRGMDDENETAAEMRRSPEKKSR